MELEPSVEEAEMPTPSIEVEVLMEDSVEVEELPLEIIEECPELKPGEYLRDVNGVQWVAMTDVNGVSSDLYKL